MRLLWEQTDDKLKTAFVHIRVQSKSTLCNCLNVRELFARNRCYIWNLNECNVTRIHKHLVREPTLNHLPSLASLVQWSLSVHLRTKSLRVLFLLQWPKFQILNLFLARSSLTFRQLQHVDALQMGVWNDKTHSILAKVCRIVWLFVYKLSGLGFESWVLRLLCFEIYFCYVYGNTNT